MARPIALFLLFNWAVFAQQLYLALDDGRYGFINETADSVISNQFLDASEFSEGLARAANEKGFGFIIDGETGQDIFVHQTGLVDEIRENDRVQFEVAQGKKGPNATKVQVI